MNKDLEAAISGIEKQYGRGAIMPLGSKNFAKVEVISTSSLALDLALGVGGLPRGRIVEVYGPESGGKTTLTLHVIAEAQKLGGQAAFIDAEHALDPVYAKKLGVDVDNLLVSQPDNGEQALEIVEALIRSNSVDVVVVDSVAALVPKAELEGEMGEPQMGLQARLMSQALRKLTAAVSHSHAVLIFINQIREKIGVMFGCMSYGTRIVLADGTTEKIGKIVNQKLPVSVLSLDKSGMVVPRRVIDWHNNGKTDYFLQFVVRSPEGSGTRKFACTADHILLGLDGEVRAADVQVGNFLINVVKGYTLNKQQEALIVGSALGDGSLRGTSVRFGHGPKQEEYLKWKHDVMGNTANKIKNCRFDTKPLRLSWLADAPFGKKSGHRALSGSFLGLLTIPAIAVWYQDDGTYGGSHEKWGWGKSTIACKSFTYQQRQRLAEAFVAIGLPRPSIIKQGLMFSGDSCRVFHDLISDYIHPSMAYKLHPMFHNRGWAWTITGNAQEVWRPERAEILKKYTKPKTKSMARFDLTVEDCHNYLADHIVVHNSPETTTGGRALKFYSSVRIDVRKTQTIKQGDVVIGAETKFKVVKNKVASPFKEAEGQIIYGHGISKETDLLRLGEKHGVFEKSGTWYSFKGERLGQGFENARQFLISHPDMATKIDAALRAILFSREEK